MSMCNQNGFYLDWKQILFTANVYVWEVDAPSEGCEFEARKKGQEGAKPTRRPAHEMLVRIQMNEQ